MANKQSLLDIYKVWLMGRKITSPDNYISFINRSPYYRDFLENLLYYCAKIDYSKITYIPSVLSKMKDELKINKPNEKTYFKRFTEFIYFMQHDKRAKLLPHNNKEIFAHQLGFLKKLKSEIKLDAMDFLIQELGEDQFIKKAIESSLFFSWDLVKDRHEAIVKGFKNGIYIPGRKGKRIITETVLQEQINEKDLLQSQSGKRKTLNVGKFMNLSGKEWKVFVDAFGNDEVIKLIREKTGYVVARGQKKSNLPNFIISHVWGNAGDPRYFTSLWNIALIPAWANFLMDKNTTETNLNDEEVQNETFAGNIASKLKCTIMSVCKQLYNGKDNRMEKLDWASLNMPCPPLPKDTSDIIKGEYHIKVIQEKEEEIVGSILTEIIQIK